MTFFIVRCDVIWDSTRTRILESDHLDRAVSRVSSAADRHCVRPRTMLAGQQLGSRRGIEWILRVASLYDLKYPRLERLRNGGGARRAVGRGCCRRC